MNRHITLQTPYGSLHGQLELPEMPRGLILIVRAHHAAADTAISSCFADLGFATLTFELLTSHEMQFPDATQNVPRLTRRLVDVLDMTRNDGDMEPLPLAIFASGDVTPAAIRAAAQRDLMVKAVACNGGLIDRAGIQALELLEAPLLIIFGADDALAKNGYLRASPHLHGAHSIHPLGFAEDPAQPAAIWILGLFPADR